MQSGGVNSENYTELIDKVNELSDEKANTKYVDSELQELKNQIGDISTTEVSETEPTEENVNLWIDPSSNNTFNLPEINDEEISTADTWSSNKINEEISKLSQEIANAGSGTITGLVQTENIADGAVTFSKLGLVTKTEDEEEQEPTEKVTNENLVKEYVASDGGKYLVLDASTVPDEIYTVNMIYNGGSARTPRLGFRTMSPYADNYQSDWEKVGELENISGYSGIVIYKTNISELKQIAINNDSYYNQPPRGYIAVMNAPTINSIGVNLSGAKGTTFTKHGTPYVAKRITQESLTAYIMGEEYDFDGGNSEPNEPTDNLSDIDADFVALIKRIAETVEVTIPDSVKDTYPHYGKRAIMLGDSNFAFWNMRTNNGMPKTFNKVGMSVKDGYCQGGAAWFYDGFDDPSTRTKATMSGQLDAVIAEYPTADDNNIYVLLFGTNDYRPGEITDETGASTMVGAMRYSIDRLFAYHPNAIVLGLVPPHRYDAPTQAQIDEGIASAKAYLSMNDKVNLIRKVYDEYSIPTIDMFGACNIREADLVSDKLHLSEIGYDKLSRAIVGKINAI